MYWGDGIRTTFSSQFSLDLRAYRHQRIAAGLAADGICWSTDGCI